MLWTREGANSLLQVRCAVLNGLDMRNFKRWYPPGKQFARLPRLVCSHRRGPETNSLPLLVLIVLREGQLGSMVASARLTLYPNVSERALRSIRKCEDATRGAPLYKRAAPSLH